MHKVIVERPRWGSARRNRKTALRLDSRRSAEAWTDGEDFDGGPSRAPCSRHQKGLNENLAPLKRYLAKQVGRPWDKVYSEIRERIPGSAVGLHVIDHVRDFVATEVFYENGALFERGRFGRPIAVDGLYVHPRTGILRTTKPQARRKKWPTSVDEQELNLVRLGEHESFEKINGIWYRTRYGVDAATQAWSLIFKQQCDRKTVRAIESGDFGEITSKR